MSETVPDLDDLPVFIQAAGLHLTEVSGSRVVVEPLLQGRTQRLWGVVMTQRPLRHSPSGSWRPRVFVPLMRGQST